MSLADVLEKLKTLPSLKLIGGIRGTAGRFALPDSLLDCPDAFEIMNEITRDVLIVGCDHDVITGRLIYSAYSSKFRRLYEGEEPPKYDVVLERSGEVIFREVKK